MGTGTGVTTDFEACAREALDIWGRTTLREMTSPEPLIDTMRPFMSQPDMNLMHLDMAHDDPMNYRLSIPVMNTEFGTDGMVLGAFDDPDFIRTIVLPHYTEARNGRHSRVDTVTTQMSTSLGRFFIVYERVILPQKTNKGPSKWAVSFSKTNIVLPAPEDPPVLTQREADVLRCLTRGMTSKEIGLELQRSPRTIEHRIESLRSKFKATNVAHLIALSVSSSFLG